MVETAEIAEETGVIKTYFLTMDISLEENGLLSPYLVLLAETVLMASSLLDTITRG